jgi:hypothetical protein
VPRYCVEIAETITYGFFVEAATDDEAIRIACTMDTSEADWSDFGPEIIGDCYESPTEPDEGSN